jgi:sugar/nucleoside kinase (ribokinase family)
MNLNTNEKRVLNLLRKNPFISQKDLALEVDLSRPAVANIISSLQQKGYILGKPYLLREDKYVTCIGGANFDVILRIEDTLIKGTSNPVHTSKSLGGVVRNVAENLARLGLKVSLMSLLGEDPYGQELLDKSNDLMETFACDALSHERTGTYYAVIDKKGDMSYGFADMHINRLMDRSWVLKHKKHLFMSEYMIVDLNVSKDAIEAIFEIKEETNIPLAIIGVSSPKMRHLPENIQGLDLLICNVDESQTYFNTSETDEITLCKHWLDKGVKNIIVTAGKKGAFYGNQEGVHYQKAHLIDPKLIVDVTGAGDAFSSAVLYGIIKGESLEYSSKLGAVNASLTIQVPYAVNPNNSIKKIEKELKNYES